MSFYLTLPSNASMDMYPNNVVSNFITSLQNPIKLEGEWVVALTKIIYRNSIESLVGIFTIMTKNNVSTVPIKIKELNNFSEVMTQIKKELEPYSASLVVTEIEGTLEIKPLANVSLSLTGVLPYLLDFEPKRSYNIKNPLIIEKQDRKIQKIDSLFLYTDIIEDQYVGNTKAKLLDVVQISGKVDETTTVNILNPNYVKVSNSEISTINIMIKDGFGDFIHFTNLAKVIVKLHFKPKNYE